MKEPTSLQTQIIYQVFTEHPRTASPRAAGTQGMDRLPRHRVHLAHFPEYGRCQWTLEKDLLLRGLKVITQFYFEFRARVTDCCEGARSTWPACIASIRCPS